uniref:Death domain-containing protein n=1 Tax=Amphimedon queenslandica TaxID=400682 RepID=A0A1X7TQA7_AMPQE
MVLNKALFAPTKWDDLGLKLGLLMTRLNVIAESGDSFKHLKKTIEAWLMGADNVKIPTATVSSNGSSRSTTTSSASRQTVSTSNTDNGKRSLDIEDVEMVTTVLNKALFGATKWANLGLKLGLLISRLNVIGEEGGDAYRHLRRTIEVWLEEEDNVTSRTWQTLIEAVARTGDRAAAQIIPDILKTLYNIRL